MIPSFQPGNNNLLVVAVRPIALVEVPEQVVMEAVAGPHQVEVALVKPMVSWWNLWTSDLVRYAQGLAVAVAVGMIAVVNIP